MPTTESGDDDNDEDVRDPDCVPSQHGTATQATVPDRLAEEYEVEGEAREELSSSIAKPAKKTPRRQIVTECRRRGKRSEKSSKVVQNRDILNPRCASRYCFIKKTGVSECDGGETPGNQSFPLQHGVFARSETMDCPSCEIQGAENVWDR